MAFPVSLIASLLWVAAFFGLLMKWLEIPRPHQFREEPTGLLEKLSFTQYACLIGALSWGVAMFIASFLNHYLEGKMTGKPVADTSGLWTVSELLLWLVGGSFFAWVTWGRS